MNVVQRLASARNWLAALAFGSLALAPAQAQQSSGDFHSDDWVYLSAIHPHGHVNLRRTWETAEPGDPGSANFYEFVASNSYPDQVVPPLECIAPERADLRDLTPSPPLYTMDHHFIDTLIDKLEAGAKWMVTRGAGFPAIRTYANGRRYEVERNSGPASLIFGDASFEDSRRRGNFFGCRTYGFMGVSNRMDTDSSYYLAIGPELQKKFRGTNYEWLLDWLVMHEFTHISDNNTAPYKQQAGTRLRAYLWVDEGIPDAVGIHRLFSMNGGQKATMAKVSNIDKKAFEDSRFSRLFMARNYNIPLNFGTVKSDEISKYTNGDEAVIKAIDDSMLSMLDYQTNGFWYHVLERYLNKTPGRFTEFNKTLTSPPSNITRQVDEFLDGIDGDAMDGLEHVLPQFLTEYTNWWEDRSGGLLNSKKWLDYSFNKCTDVTIGADKASSGEVTFELSEYAGKCIQVYIDPSLAGRVNSMDLMFDAQDGGADEVYVGVAKIRGTSNGDMRCIDVVEKVGVKRAPCLLIPAQGKVDWRDPANFKYDTLLSRAFHVGKLRGTEGQLIGVRMIVTRVPEDHHDVNDNLERRSFRMRASLNLAKLKKRRKTNTPDAANPDADDDGPETIVRWGARQGDDPIIPLNDGKACVDDMFAPTRTSFGPQAVNGAVGRGMRQGLFLDEIIDEETTGRSVGVTFITPVPYGYTGEVDITGTGNNIGFNGETADNTIIFQDHANPSRFEILAYNDDEMSFEGTVNLCITNAARLMTDKDPCVSGQRESFDIEGAIAFPTVQSGETQMEEVCSSSYAGYQEIRLTRIRGNGALPSIRNPSTPQPVGGNSSGGSTKAGVCSVRQASGACDCSCDAKACFDDRQAAGSLGADFSCKLTCGKKWMACPAN